MFTTKHQRRRRKKQAIFFFISMFANTSQAAHLKTHVPISMSIEDLFLA